MIELKINKVQWPSLSEKSGEKMTEQSCKQRNVKSARSKMPVHCIIFFRNGNFNGHAVEKILKNIRGPLGLMCGNGLIEDWLRRGGNLKGRPQLWRRRKENLEMSLVVLHQIKPNVTLNLSFSLSKKKKKRKKERKLSFWEHAFWVKKNNGREIKR